MKDKSLGIWMIVMFGVSGLAVIALAWFLPSLQPDRITATFAGSFGVFIATIRAFTLKQSTANKKVAVEVENES